MLRLIYFGTAPFAVPALRALLKERARFEVVAVVSQPDKPVGRKGEIIASPVAMLARKHGLPLLQPTTLRSDESAATLAAHKADLFVVAAYGKIIPKNILDLPRFGSLNLHGSLLPKYRGASPIQTAILSGEEVTGVSLMVMDEAVDHGPIVATIEVPIAGDDTHATLETKLAEAGAALLVALVEPFTKGEITPTMQEHNDATFTKILEREDGLVHWRDEEAAQIGRKLRAYTPWPGMYFVLKKNGVDLRVKILAADVTDAPTGLPPGTYFVLANDSPAIAAKIGAVILREVQPEGKKSMPGKAFVNGYKDFTGSLL